MEFKQRIFIMVALGLFACLMAAGSAFDAGMLSAFFDNKSLEHSPVWLACLLTFLLSVLPLFWFAKLSLFHSLLSVFVYLIAVLTLIFSIAYFYGMWIPPAGAVLAILLAYPLWSCGKLNVAQAALDLALQNLQSELARLGMEHEPEASDGDEDPQQARIRKLALTASHLRDMHKSRSDTLVFISHDIRSPLGAAKLLLDKFEDNKYSVRMRQLLERAYTMAESFLNATRAEMSDVNKFHVLNMVSLTQQVVDDVYELLAAKSIRLEMSHPDDNVWVKGDFGLLFRAVTNVVLNAINYSPEGGLIKVMMEKDEVVLRLKVIDQGPGIPEDKIQTLFKRFSRVESDYQDQSGSGLGLYFVGVTVRKHRGTVSAGNTRIPENINIQGAEFVITLPLERRRNNIPVIYDRRVQPESTFEDTI